MLNFDVSQHAKRSPVCAQNIVSSSQPLATQAGIDILRRGGNAVDAALATAITLTVVEPTGNGVGGDAFAIVWNGKELSGLNASGCSPAGWTPANFSGSKKMPSFGWDSITVPGAVSAWVALSEKHGRLPFSDLFESAIRYARDGFQVAPHTAALWSQASDRYTQFPDFNEHFMPVPKPGQLFLRPDLATTLEEIAITGGQSFYTGSLAERIISASNKGGGLMSLDDLAQHTPLWVTPIAQPYRDILLHEIPPNGQGLAAQICLGILRHLPPGDLDHPITIHRQIEAMKIAIRAAFDHFADLRAMQISPETLLGEASLYAAAQGISERAASLPPVQLPISHDTVYLCTADAEGMMVSYIQSNYMGFGSGIVIPGTGIAMQNRGRGFSLEPGHPNVVAPSKRPYHTIIPGFVTSNYDTKMAFGIMGGQIQHQGHVQLVHRIFDHDQDPQMAVDAPRWIVNPDFTVGLEPGIPESVLQDLLSRGHQVTYENRVGTFGGAQLIYQTKDGYIAGSDHRKDGQAAGY